MKNIQEGKLVFPKGNGDPGRTTGGTRYCKTTGCLSERIGVRWPDGNLTWCCLRATEYIVEKDVYRLVPQNPDQEKASVPQNPYDIYE